MPPKKFISYKKNTTTTFQKTSTFLLIVESPSKCAKIESFLGSQYQCIASKGHLRTINSLKSINPKENYKIDFTIIEDKKSHIDFMRTVITQYPTENIFLASDADREGEAIAWHICDLFNLPVETTPRILFREITEPAIKSAIQNPTLINMHLVNSQKARQILDIFVGFKISPYLWKYIFSSKTNSLSAGRCQTPCLRLVYDNEKERQIKTVEKTYKTTATFFSQNIPFVLNHEFSSQEETRDFLNESKNVKHIYKMTIGSPKESVNKPPKPFNTSRLLQVANNVLHLSPKQTMAFCQILYQEGHITYMRTDSVQYSKVFLNKATECIEKKWGKHYIGSLDSLEHNDPLNPHEAIRVTHLDTMTINNEKEPQVCSLYKLIWKNTIESCMKESTSKIIPVNITAPQEKIYIHSLEIPIFLGWKIVSLKKMDTDEQNQGSSVLLFLESILKSKTPISHNIINSVLTVHSNHKHYTESTLIQKLEDLGIGRPSTFSMLIDTIQERGYVKKMDIEGEQIKCIEFILNGNVLKENQIEKVFGNEKGKLVIQAVGILSIEFLISNYNSLFSYDYTKKMEDDLDHHSNPFSICEECNNEIKELSKNIRSVEKQAYPINDEYEVVIQRFGPVLRKIGCSNENGSPQRGADSNLHRYKSIRKDIQLNMEKLKNGEYTINDLIEIPNEDLGIYKSHHVYLKTGTYGPFIEWGDKKESIKHIEKPLNEIKLEDIIPLIQTNMDINDDEKIRKPPVIVKNMLRRIDDDLSIRKGKYGAYIYYKTAEMGSPEFFQLKGFKQGYQHLSTPKSSKDVFASAPSTTELCFKTCEIEELRTWIKEKHNIPK